LTGYGGGALGLQTILANNEVYMSQEECEKIIEAFFDAYPSLRKFLSYYKRFITETGVAVSVFGRVRILEEVFGDDREAAAKALRAGCNHVIQSTASDMMLTALRAIELLMRAEGLESVLVSTVHDSLLIDAVRSELPRVHAIVHDVLNNFPEVMKGLFGDAYDLSWLTVPIVGDCEVGLTYYDSVKIPVIPHDKIDWDALLAA
jgi:DNA polymerase-1